MVERHLREARSLQGKALQCLQALSPEELGPADLLRYIVEAVKLERLVLGEPDTVQQHKLTGRGGGAPFLALHTIDLLGPVQTLQESEQILGAGQATFAHRISQLGIGAKS